MITKHSATLTTKVGDLIDITIQGRVVAMGREGVVPKEVVDGSTEDRRDLVFSVTPMQHPAQYTVHLSTTSLEQETEFSDPQPNPPSAVEEQRTN